MTEKQRRFADEYLIDLNATRAYKDAYPRVKRDETAAVCASKMLRNPKVAAYIQERMQERQERVQVQQDQVLRGILEIAFPEGEDALEAISARDRLKALELLGRHIGLFDRKDDLDRAEQQARIDKLRAEAKGQEAESRAVTIRFIDTEGGEE